MSLQNTTNQEVVKLKKKLDAAVNARLELQSSLEVQSSAFIQFITKLSQTAKGIDVVLDNKLAKLRKTLEKSLSWQEVENMFKDISQLLQKHSTNNDKNIDQLHEKFHHAGLVLQQLKNLPPSLRRELRGLIDETKERKNSVLLYISPLSTLLEYYQAVLKAKEKMINNATQGVTPEAAVKTKQVDHDVIERFSLFLTKLNVSTPYKLRINKIRTELSSSISHQHLLDSFLEVFDIINKDLIQERNTAKAFLSTLSTTLSSVQNAVQTTVASTDEAKTKHNILNQKLKKNITEMAAGLNSANSLVDMKIDINEKLKNIAASLEEKTTFEIAQFKEMSANLSKMQEKVSQLEIQGKSFEKLIQEQQARSYQDALTKLGNRAAFDDYFAQQMVRFHNAPFELAIVVLDLDNFKRINDTYGHTAGDKTLQVIASTLTKSVTKKEFVGRYGGEEFVMIFSNINQEELIKKLNNIRLKVARLPFKFKNDKVSMTMSIGATHITSADNVHIAFERADVALYQAKENGKNQVIYA